MKTVAVVQARIGSTRLPGKVLADIAGKPMLWHVLRRTKAARRCGAVVLATTTSAADRALEAVAHECGAECFFGDENDVLDRYRRAAERFQADVIVRLTADCPLLDPAVIDACVALRHQKGCDYASNTIRRSYPDGLDVEVFRREALERAWREARLNSEREHVTPYIWKNPSIFSLADLVQEENLSDSRWCVDDPRDLEFARAVFDGLGGGARLFGMMEVVALLRRHPRLSRMNAGIECNEGYEKSLREDRAVDPKRI